MRGAYRCFGRCFSVRYRAVDEALDVAVEERLARPEVIGQVLAASLERYSDPEPIDVEALEAQRKALTEERERVLAPTKEAASPSRS